MNHTVAHNQPIAVFIDPNCAHTETARRILERFSGNSPATELDSDSLTLRLDSSGLSLISGTQTLQGDFTRLLPRLKGNALAGELLVRAAKIKDTDAPLTAVDATAGLGEDSFFLAAAGFHVKLYEHNPVIFELLQDAHRRAMEIPELLPIMERMELFHGNSVDAMVQLTASPDVILLDPMFPERQKSALVKKKLQMIQKLEFPCVEEKELLLTAMGANPKKLVIKRPPKGPYLAGIKPDYSITGKAVRFDCFASPGSRVDKYR